ncbi:sulfate/molybdate ABC transporter ATP-binding protein [Nocardia neocaledoniensis]|uniref:sulfate/molybdate ABC transporter ATP-binding protein n=1 Tax=Nocardia neocaledoniensis TaxID=236511 RepID=UPI00245817F9|nr:ABC transporter ATP-binding protein [Nocardia neocaledoniensis]
MIGDNASRHGASRRNGSLGEPEPVGAQADSAWGELDCAPQRAGLSVAARIGGRGLDVHIEVGPGEVLAVLGPNGAGKSSLLQVIAGLVSPEEGRVRLGERTLTDVAKGIAVPAHRRGISLLAQDPLLFPHLTVRDNVAFGPRSRGARKRAAQAIAEEWLAAVDATELADRHPGALSGGQAQRVALARALAVDPDLLLLDEPMSALDVDVAPAMRSLLRRVLRDEASRAHARCAVLVTHDIIDAITLADRLVILEAGRIVDAGPVAEVMSHPRSPFAARVAGLNLLRGTAIEYHQVEPADVEPPSTAPGLPATAPTHADPGDAGTPTDQPGRPTASMFGTVDAAGLRVDGRTVGDLRPGDSAAAVFSPAAVAVFTTPPDGSPRNVFAGRIADIADHGGIVRVRGELGPAGSLHADLTPAAVAHLGLTPGATVYFVVKATEVRVYAC